MVEEGHGVRKVSRKLGVSINTVTRWKNRPTADDKTRPGRPTIISPTTRNMIKKRIYRNLGGSTRKCAAALNLSKRFQMMGKKIAHTTMHNHLKTTDWGSKAFKSPKKPLLSPKNIKDRLKLADYLDKNAYSTPGERGAEKRWNILFTDETWIFIHPHGNPQHTRYRTEKRTEVSLKKSLQVMVAGGYCTRGVTDLHFVPA